jgi:hypothetical protein
MYLVYDTSNPCISYNPDWYWIVTKIKRRIMRATEKKLLLALFVMIGLFGYYVYDSQEKYTKLEKQYWKEYNRAHELDYSLMICQFLRKKCSEKKCKDEN